MIRLSHSAAALLAAVSLVLMGVVAGITLDRTILTQAHAGPSVAGDPRHHDEVLAELQAQLVLSASQSKRVEEIFARHQDEIVEAWSAVHANLRRAIQDATSEIEAELDSAQIDRLHAWLARRHGPDAAPTPKRTP